MTKMISLLAAAYVAGTLRQPDEGALPASDEEAQRLVAEGRALDVTADFESGGDEPAQPNPSDHADGDDHKPARRKASASKE